MAVGPQPTTRSSQDRESKATEDCARVEIRTSWPADRLHRFVQDAERLLRLNPHYEFNRFTWLDETGHAKARLQGINHANGQPFDVSLRIERTANGLLLHWEGWLKPITRIRVMEESPHAARLVIEDDYSSLPMEERRARSAEADSSLLAWAHALHRHLHWRPRLTRIPGMETLIDRYWLKMKPSARRISAMLVIVTLAELLVFAAVFAIFWLEWYG